MTETREAKKIVRYVDTYSELYKDIFISNNFETA